MQPEWNTIYWNDEELVSGLADTPVYRLELRFSAGIWPGASFGIFNVDLISCEGEAWVSAARQGWGNVKAIY